MNLRQLAPLLGCALGCYTYTPIDPVSTEPGHSVRARINATTAEQLELLLGIETRLLNGTVIATAPDTLIIEVPTAAQISSNGTMMRLRQRVSVPRSGLLLLESRTLNRGRTAVAIVVGTVAIGGLIVGGYILGPGQEKLPGGDGGTDLRIPILPLRW